MTINNNTRTDNAERNEQQVEEATLSRKITVTWEEFMAFPMEWEYDDDSWECECGLDSYLANAGC
jgi:hypothetical protein